MLTLYQFAISHYCEKARWALAHKRLEHELRNLLPGPHVAQLKKLAPKSSTPLLVHDETTVQGSGEIISYLDRTFPERPLTPADEAEAREALEWERYLDEEIGVHVRRCAYHTLLEHPSIVVPFFTKDGPWYGPLLYKLIFPTVRERMRGFMDINAETSAESRRHLEAATDRLFTHLEGRSFIVGDRFTRADLTAAALLAPVYRPAKYGLEWPAEMPPEIEELVSTLDRGAAWVSRTYAEHR